MVGSAGVAGASGVVGSAGVAGSTTVVGSAGILLSAGIIGSAGIVGGVGNVGCAACVGCIGCVNCVGCVGCIGCVGLNGAVGKIGKSQVTIRRAIPNLLVDDIRPRTRFYSGFLGFDIAMDEPGFTMFASPSNRTAQITVADANTPGLDRGVKDAQISVEVENVDALHAKARRRRPRDRLPAHQRAVGHPPVLRPLTGRNRHQRGAAPLENQARRARRSGRSPAP